MKSTRQKLLEKNDEQGWLNKEMVVIIPTEVEGKVEINFQQMEVYLPRSDLFCKLKLQWDDCPKHSQFGSRLWHIYDPYGKCYSLHLCWDRTGVYGAQYTLTRHGSGPIGANKLGGSHAI